MIYIENTQVSFGTDTGGLISLNLYFSGCKKEPHCPGCHNPDLWTRNEECVDSVRYWVEEIKKYAELIDAVVFMGGEPLDQPYELYKLARTLSAETPYQLYLYTGYEKKDIPDMIRTAFDVIIAGPYKEGIPGAGLCASGNQEVIRNVKS